MANLNYLIGLKKQQQLQQNVLFFAMQIRA